MFIRKYNRIHLLIANIVVNDLFFINSYKISNNKKPKKLINIFIFSSTSKLVILKYSKIFLLVLAASSELDQTNEFKHVNFTGKNKHPEIIKFLIIQNKEIKITSELSLMSSRKYLFFNLFIIKLKTSIRRGRFVVLIWIANNTKTR